MLAVLIGLGTWQVERLGWKQGLLAQIDRAEQGRPVPLPPVPTPFEKVAIAGRFRPDLTALYGAEVRDSRNGPVLGGRLIVPLERDGAPPILVDRGWVPLNRSAPLDQPEGETTVVGYIYPAQKSSWFSAPDDPTERHFYTRDPAAIAAALGLPKVAPFTLVALGPTPAAGYPDPAQHLPRPPNNHLSYAITWYGLAAALLAVFAVWASKGARA
jgi:surfeit locus 1 family protein